MAINRKLSPIPQIYTLETTIPAKNNSCHFSQISRKIYIVFKIGPKNEFGGILMSHPLAMSIPVKSVWLDVEVSSAGYINRKLSHIPQIFILKATLECYMDWFPSLICKNYIFKHFVKTVEPTSLKFCMIIELITLHLEYTIAQVKYANFSFAHAQTFVLINGEMATVSTGFRKLKFWLWLLWTVFYPNQTGF